MKNKKLLKEIKHAKMEIKRLEKVKRKYDTKTVNKMIFSQKFLLEWLEQLKKYKEC